MASFTSQDDVGSGAFHERLEMKEPIRSCHQSPVSIALMSELSPEEYTRLVEDNGLTRLFANRVRARIISALFYAQEPLSVAEIAAAAGVDQTVVHEALDQLDGFDLLETTQSVADGRQYELTTDDELVAALRTVAELATERYHREPVDVPDGNEN